MRATSGLFGVVLLAALCCSDVRAARKLDVKKRFSDGIDRYTNLRRQRHAEEMFSVAGSEELLDLQPGEHLKDVTTVTTAAGTTLTKLSETYQGLPVFAQSVVIETDNGEITGAISGHLVEGIEEDIPDITPGLSETDALALAAARWNDSVGDIASGSIQIELQIYVDDQGSQTEVITFLAYSVSYFIVRDDAPSRPSLVMDANSGAIVRSWEGLTSRPRARFVNEAAPFEFSAVGGNLKMGRNMYGDRLPSLNIRMHDGICYLENDKVSVVDMAGAYSWNDDEHLTRNQTSFSFPCDQGFNDSVNGAYSPMADAFFYGCITYDLFMEWVGREPLDFKIVLAAHEGEEFSNAFWDGKHTHYGDGGNQFYPFIVLDIVAHEVAHGFTEQNSGLIYAGQSGGMNEAYSDIAGAAADEYLKMTEWLNGEDAMKYEVALRYFIDPTLDGYSIGHTDQFCSSTGVHSSSGIFNRAFYLLSTTEGWTVRMAFQTFTVANQLYWTPVSEFNSGACGVMQAANDLGFNSEDVIQAFHQVGVHGCDAPPKTGLDRLLNLHSLQNQTLTFIFNLEEYIPLLRFETYCVNWWGGGYSLHVQTPRRNLSTEISGEAIYVMNPEVGAYVVSLTPTEDSFSHTDLYAVTNQIVLGEDFEFDNYTRTANGSFHLPENVVATGLPVAIRTIISDQEERMYPPRLTLNYEVEEDMNLSNEQPGCSLYNEKRWMYEAIIRNPRAGQYNYQLYVSQWVWDELLHENAQLVMAQLLLPGQV